MPDTSEIHWLAGLLEGEGSFGLRKMVTKRNGHSWTYYRPRLQVSMTDKDIVDRAAKLIGLTTYKGGVCKSGKQMWMTACQGSRAASWMMTLYPLMGQRRQAKIRESLIAFKGDQ